MESVIDRLSARSHREGECWVWAGPTAGAGYGVLKTDGESVYVHRASYEHHVGAIPEDLEIDHLCRNRLCMNPLHLEAVTHAENRRRARSTYCRRGHLLDEGRERKNHGRVCRKCDALRAKKYRQRKKVVAFGEWYVATHGSPR